MDANVTPKELIRSIERRGAKIGLRPAALCKLADINPTTWWRLKKGLHGPQYSTLQKLQKLSQHPALEAA
jgi:predicted transcriptional regulator